MTEHDTARPATSRGGFMRRLSGKWLVAAVLATAVCAGLLIVEFAGLLSSPVMGSGVVSQPAISSEEVLTVAVARTPGGPGEWSNWAMVIKYLSEEIGQPLTVRYLSNEDEAAKVIAAEDIDIAFVCAHHYLDLTEVGQSVGICTPIIDGSSTTRSMIVVRAQDSATCFEDLEGSVIALSDKSSLGGLAYFAYLAAGLGQVPETFCGQLRLGDTQEQNMHDVLDGVVRATVVSSVQVASRDMSKFKVIERSEPIGCPPVIVDSDMDPGLRTRVRDILVECDVKTLLPENSAIDGFKVLDPREYEFAYKLREACGHHVH